MSQRELSERTGIGQAQICRVEAGKEAAWATYERLFEGLGARLAVLPAPFKTDDEIVAELIGRRLQGERDRRARSLERRARRRAARRLAAAAA
jgi:hypothetical protein